MGSALFLGCDVMEKKVHGWNYEIKSMNLLPKTKSLLQPNGMPLLLLDREKPVNTTMLLLDRRSPVLIFIAMNSFKVPGVNE